MISSRLPEFFYGGDYNPEQWPEAVWEEDVALMREAGVNLVSLGVFAWAKLNPKPAEYDFGWLDRVMDLLHGSGIHACLATATATPPVWLGRAYPESLREGPDGTVYGHGSRQCYTPNSRAYREHAFALVRKIAERYGAHPALALWRANNEYGGDGFHYSYGAEDAAAFRIWLEAKYKTVDALNKAWNAAFWSQIYSDWEEVTPPRATPATPNPTQVLDFKRFFNAAYRDLFREEKRILKELTPDIPVTTNFMGTFPVIDQFSWADDLDVSATDLYPDPDPALETRGMGIGLDLARSLKRKPFILMEQAASQVNWRPVNANKRPGVMRLWSHEAIAKGADGVMFFQWRQSLAGSEKFHSAMVPAVGAERSRIFAEVKQLGSELKKLRPVLGSKVKADCALIFDWPSYWALEAPGLPRKFDYCGVMEDFHKAFRELGLAVDFVPPSADLGTYKVVLAPLLYMLSADDAEGIRSYVKGGGVFVGSFFSGIVDENDHLQTGGYPRHLRETLGLWVEEWEPSDERFSNSVRMQDGRLVSCGYLSERVHLEGAEVMGTFAEDYLEGLPALTVNSFGKGKAFYIATRPKASFYRYALRDLISQLGLERPLRDTPEAIEVGIREGENGRFLFLLNHGREAETVDLGSLGGTNLLSGKRVNGRIRLGALDVAVVHLDTSPRAGMI